MKLRITLVPLLWVAIAVAPSYGQTETAKATTYRAAVIGQGVYVRSGPSIRYYHCAQLSAPDKVVVVDKLEDWLKILPPHGTWSVISKSYVRADASGKTGSVTADHIWARAGGFPKRPGAFSMLQCAMKVGDSVRIIGEIGDYYKIEPPQGSYFWIAARHVRKIAPGTIVNEATTPPAATTQPTTPVIAPAQVDPQVKEFRALDKQLLLEYDKPVESRDYEGLVAKYQALKPTKANGLKPFVTSRLKFLTDSIERRKQAAAADKLISKTLTEMDEFERLMDKRRAERLIATPVPGMTAIGIVAPSEVYTGSAAIGRRYALRNVEKLRIEAYLRSSDRSVDLASFVGKLVEVYGSVGYDPSCGLDVIEVRKVIASPQEIPLPSPPMPSAKPAKPKDKTKDAPATQPAE